MTKDAQKELNQFIVEISKESIEEGEDSIRIKAERLLDIYAEDFHHMYSEFFPLIADMRLRDQAEILLNNLERIKTYVDGLESLNKEDNIEYDKHAFGAVRKLCDHINLEVSRMKVLSKTDQQLDQLTKNLDDAKNRVGNLSKEVDEASNKVKDSHGQLITILGIFAAIVIAFAGGIAMFGNALASVSNAPLFNLLLVVLAVGIVLIDSITALIYAISRMVGKSICSNCEHSVCDCKKDDGTPKCNDLKKLRKRLPFVFWVNVVLLALFFVTLVLYVVNVKLKFLY